MKNKIYRMVFIGILIGAILIGYYFGIFLPKKEAKIAKQQKQELEIRAEVEKEKQEQDAAGVEKERIKALLDSTKEITFSAEELKSYYAAYEDPFVIHIRKALNGYLNGTNEGMEMPDLLIEKGSLGDARSGLASFDSEYYKSKFVVLYLDNALAGGKEAAIIFQDRPDKIFTAWVYKLGDGNYDLRGFWENTKATQDIDVTLKTFGKYIFDKDHSM